MKLLRFIVALLVFALLTGSAWMFVVEPVIMTHQLREIGRATPDLSERVAERTQQLLRVRTTLVALRTHTDVVDRFDRWRDSEITVLGQATQPWEVVRRRSDIIAAADLGVDSLVTVLADADEILAGLEASESSSREFTQLWNSSAWGWTSRAQLLRLREEATTLERDLVTVRAQVSPAAEALRSALDGWTRVEGALTDSAAPLGLGIVTNAARTAFAALEGPIRAPAENLLAAMDDLGGEVDAIEQIVETASAMTMLPAWLEVGSSPP
ncbi:MAG: hypothetical protein ACI81R_000032 [Bradymonadia bacterium]|jgi:hypothetical protein